MRLLGITGISNENSLKKGKGEMVAPFSMGMAGAQIRASKAVRKNLITTTTDKGAMLAEYKPIAHDRRLQPGTAFVQSVEIVNTHGHIGLFFPNKFLAARGVLPQAEMIPQGFSGELWISIIVTAPAYLEEGTLLGEVLFVKEETSADFLSKRVGADEPFMGGKFPNA